MTTRFVILHHAVGGGEHWDLMLERGDVLLTWQLHGEPRTDDDLPMPANHIQDHRKAYLEYEGPISGDRGIVKRVDAGTVTSVVFTASQIEFELQGRRLVGRFRLVDHGDRWQFEAAAPS